MSSYLTKHPNPVGREPIPVRTTVGGRCRIVAKLTKIQGTRLDRLGFDDWSFTVLLKEDTFSTPNVATRMIPEGDFDTQTGAFTIPTEARKYIFDVDDGCGEVKIKVVIDAVRPDGGGDPDQGREVETLLIPKCGGRLQRDIEVTCYDDGDLSDDEDQSTITFSFSFKSECVDKDDEF